VDVGVFGRVSSTTVFLADLERRRPRGGIGELHFAVVVRIVMHGLRADEVGYL
jgi:hypothetical protein